MAPPAAPLRQTWCRAETHAPSQVSRGGRGGGQVHRSSQHRRSPEEGPTGVASGLGGGSSPLGS